MRRPLQVANAKFARERSNERSDATRTPSMRSPVDRRHRRFANFQRRSRAVRASWSPWGRMRRKRAGARGVPSARSSLARSGASRAGRGTPSARSRRCDRGGCVDPVVAPLAYVEMHVLRERVRIHTDPHQLLRPQVGRQRRRRDLGEAKSMALPNPCCPSRRAPGSRYPEMSSTRVARK